MLEFLKKRFLFLFKYGADKKTVIVFRFKNRKKIRKSMISPKKRFTGALTSNYFLRKMECYECDAKQHRLFLKESENYVELLCKGCTKKEKIIRLIEVKKKMGKKLP